MPGTWKHWDLMKLQSDGDGAANEVNAATKKMMEAAALNKKSMQRSTASRVSSVCQRPCILTNVLFPVNQCRDSSVVRAPDS